ncbi:MAG: MBL fold metallo-hydrolase [Candidatus Dormibacteraeota bacterium]|nr:MBL fold metallo-hydrolase [Candidatus Dormibacteraeota bacterium]
MTAVEVTGLAQERSWRTTQLPPVEAVAPGLWSIPVPLPNNPLRYVLVYAFELHDGVAVVDTGWNTEEAWTALSGGLRHAGFEMSDVRAALITHIHPDHFGLAGRLREASGAWVALHPADAELLPSRYGIDVQSLLAQMRTFLGDCGVPADVLDELTEASMGIREFVALTQPDVLLEDGRRVELDGWNLFAVHTPGHSAGHCCFHERDRRLLISGDHVLPRISPSVALHAQAPANPLADFLDSLNRVRGLDVDEVMPAHEWRFRGLAARVDELVAHHQTRLDEVERALRHRDGATVWDITLQLTWSRDWSEVRGYMRRAAVGETLAHLVLLEGAGRVRRDDGHPSRWYLTSPAAR